jgi:cellulose synthase/poly-beta-1,6-N-acetylglucosamine synthase-like glycosyltransferase
MGAAWIETMVSYLGPDVAMVTGYVESTTPEDRGGPVQRFDAVDWFTLMLTSRSLARFGWALASSANNQAYRRSAFEAAGGFGASGRAPSGDEDLLVQRIGRLPGSRVVFADDPSARVRTEPIASLPALLRQRRRWVSRYHHSLHYHPGFLAGIVVLGGHSAVLALAVAALPAAPHAAPWVLGEWALVWTVQAVGLYVGTGQLGRRDLWGWPTLVWALFHPPFIALVSIWSFLQPGDWGSGSPGYRRRILRRRLREVGRKLRTGPGGV